MNKLYRIAIVGLLVAFGAGLCYAPIEDKPPGKEFHGELSDAEMAQNQRGKMTASTPGSYGSSSGSSSSSRGKGNDKGAAAIIGSAGSSHSEAVKTLDQAQRDMDRQPEERRTPVQTFMLGGLFLMFGIVAAYGVRAYVDKVAPDPSKKVKKRW